MVLVDTSVGIRFLANRAPYAAELDRLLGLDEVMGHEFGLRRTPHWQPRRPQKAPRAVYEGMHQAGIVPHRDVVVFVRGHDLHGRGVGWIEVHLLASSIVGRLQLDGRPALLHSG